MKDRKRDQQMYERERAAYAAELESELARLKDAPPRETFDPEAVRALLDECVKLAPWETIHGLAKRVRDSEKK